MDRLKYVIGQKVNKWTILEELEGSRYGAEYLCSCECGKKLTLTATRLKNAVGCRSCANSHPSLKIGDKFHKWTIISYKKATKYGNKYRCRCECGNENDISASRLISGDAKQCRSCASKSIKIKGTTIVGNIYGKWKVIEKISSKKYKCECQCDLKTLKIIDRSNLVTGACKMCPTCIKIEISKRRWGGYKKISGHKWAVIKRGAISRKFTFDITIEDAWEKFEEQKGLCALSGIPIFFKEPFHIAIKTGEVEETASLDRINSKEGYTMNNIQWIHKDLQKMKWDFDQKYFLEMCEKISEYKNG